MLGSNPPTSTGYPLDRLPLQAKPQIMDMIVAMIGWGGGGGEYACCMSWRGRGGGTGDCAIFIT